MNLFILFYIYVVFNFHICWLIWDGKKIFHCFNVCKMIFTVDWNLRFWIDIFTICSVIGNISNGCQIGQIGGNKDGINCNTVSMSHFCGSKFIKTNALLIFVTSFINPDIKKKIDTILFCTISFESKGITASCVLLLSREIVQQLLGPGCRVNVRHFIASSFVLAGELSYDSVKCLSWVCIH